MTTAPSGKCVAMPVAANWGGTTGLTPLVPTRGERFVFSPGLGVTFRMFVTREVTMVRHTNSTRDSVLDLSNKR